MQDSDTKRFREHICASQDAPVKRISRVPGHPVAPPGAEGVPRALAVSHQGEMDFGSAVTAHGYQAVT